MTTLHCVASILLSSYPPAVDLFQLWSVQAATSLAYCYLIDDIQSCFYTAKYTCMLQVFYYKVSGITIH